MKILIITAGRYPVPAVKGGAVSNLVEHLIESNSDEKEADLFVTSPYDSVAEKEAEKYNNCKFSFIKIPKVLVGIENIIYKVMKIAFPKKNIIGIKSICSFSWFILKNGIILKNNDFDGVIIENTARLFWCFKLFGNRKKYKGKVYYHLHNEPKKLGGCESIIKDCKKIICVSEYIKNVLMSPTKKLFIDDVKKLEVLYNSIDTQIFQCSSEESVLEFKKKLGIEKEDRVILFSGRIDNEKGVLELLESLKYIKTQNIKLLIVGSSFYGMNIKTPFEEKIIKIIDDNKDKVLFTGFLKYSEMPLAYSTCEIAVLPSMWEEPAGLTIIEAMSCGKAVITTKSGGIPEYTNSDSAILLERDKNISQNIADNIDFLLANNKVKQEMGIKARKRVVENYDSKQYMKKMIDIIKR